MLLKSISKKKFALINILIITNNINNQGSGKISIQDRKKMFEQNKK